MSLAVYHHPCGKREVIAGSSRHVRCQTCTQIRNAVREAAKAYCDRRAQDLRSLSAKGLAKDKAHG